jgi:hypothetical protein
MQALCDTIPLHGASVGRFETIFKQSFIYISNSLTYNR